MDPKELDKLGVLLAKDFLENNISLNEGLKKVAGDNGLNKQQLQRVAESANVNTYLGLIKVAKDRYLKFDVADANKVYEELVKEGHSEQIIDEYEIDNSDIDVKDIFSLYRTASNLSEDEFKDLLDENLKSYNTPAFKKAASYLPGVVEFLDYNLTDKRGSFLYNVEKAEKLVKQELLKGTSFEDISNVIKTAAICTGEAVCEHLKNRLSKLPIDFDKQAEFTEFIIDTESELFKVAELMDKDFLQAIEIEDACKQYIDLYKYACKKVNAPDMLKDAGIFNTTGGLFKWFKEHPKTTAAIAMLVAYKLGRATANKKNKENNRDYLSRDAVNLRLRRYQLK